MQPEIGTKPTNGKLSHYCQLALLSGFRSLDYFPIAVNIVRDVILSIDVDMKKFLDGIKNGFMKCSVFVLPRRTKK